jgi:exodeoxyribonuclease V alpha subunit
VLELLNDPPADVTWITADVGQTQEMNTLELVHAASVTAARAIFEAASAGEARAALQALASFRILCAHRRGPYGVSTWTARIQGWLEAELDGFAIDDPWYVGRPLLVTENDYELRLYNGDTGVIVQAGPDRVAAAFERQGQIIEYSPTRLSAIDTVYSMTIHKSQGSQFDTAAVLLPDPTSRILSRELLYTAVTRARERLIIVSTEDTIRTAVRRPAARASGLRRRLWDREA